MPYIYQCEFNLQCWFSHFEHNAFSKVLEPESDEVYASASKHELCAK